MVKLQQRGIMELKFAKSKDKFKWNNFVKKSSLGSFLQSWQWGDFQESIGNKTYRFKITEKGKIIATILLISQKLPKNLSWLYSPRGPVLGVQNWELRIGQDLISKISQIARKERAVFLRFEPKQTPELKLKIPFQFRKAVPVQPVNTLILNLEKSETGLLAQMHHKTRYNIRLSERKGVTIRTADNNQSDIDRFYEMLAATSKRNKIKIFPKKYYQQMLKLLFQNKMLELLIAEYKGKPIAGIMVSFFGPEAAYLHGASLYQFRGLMAPHLLQWQAICRAKERGCQRYDFWGIMPQNQPRHKWAGITRFKKGFGGEEINYLGCLDLVYLPFWYYLYKSGNFIKRMI